MNQKTQLEAVILNVYFGETEIGTGPRGGHCGNQWMATIRICDLNGSKAHDVENVILNKGDGYGDEKRPTKNDMIVACEKTIKEFKSRIIARQEREKEQKSKMKSIIKSALSIKVRA